MSWLEWVPGSYEPRGRSRTGRDWDLCLHGVRLGWVLIFRDGSAWTGYVRDRGMRNFDTLAEAARWVEKQGTP